MIEKMGNLRQRYGTSIFNGRHKRLVILAAASAGLMWSATGTAHAAGFDCRKASTTIERTICRDPQLSRLDGDLAQLYREVQPEVAGVDGETGRRTDGLAVEQRYWLKHVRGACKVTNVVCLKRAYTARIAEIRKNWSNAL